MIQLRTKKDLGRDYFTDEIVPRISREQSLGDSESLILSIFKDVNKILKLAEKGGAWSEGWEDLFLEVDGFLRNSKRAQWHEDWAKGQILNGFQFNELEKTYLGNLSEHYACFEDAAKQMAEARKKCLRFSKV